MNSKAWRAFNRVFIGLILACVMVFSTVNTFHFFASLGFTLLYAIVSTVMVMALLVMGCGRIIRSRGVETYFISDTLASIIPTMLGVGLTGWANVVYFMAYGIGGIVLGSIVTIVPLVITIYSISAKGNLEI